MAGLRARLFPKHEVQIDDSIATDEFLQAFSTIVGLDQLLENFSAKLRENLHAETVYLVLFEPITNRYVGKKAKGKNSPALTHLNFSKNDNLIRWLNVNRTALDLAGTPEVMRYLTNHEREILVNTGTSLVFPLIVLNRLTGALFIGAKSDGMPFVPSEIAVISMLANRSALSIEHALMYQFQEDKLRRLFRADSLATMGELAAGAAHEIRNPLTSIRSAAQFLRKELPEGRRPMMDGIIEEVDRIDRIIQGLLSFSKSSELHLDELDLRDVLDQTLLLLEPEFRKHAIEVRRNFQDADTRISADPSQLKQVFLNIILNSIQAMPSGGILTLTIANVTNSSDTKMVMIQDTGEGIPEQNIARLFDPFFTTKETGTGLGLSISYGIVSRHGGEIEIRSSTTGPQRGTTVTIMLPVIPIIKETQHDAR